MPKVGKKSFKYTRQGIADAKSAAKVAAKAKAKPKRKKKY